MDFGTVRQSQANSSTLLESSLQAAVSQSRRKSDANKCISQNLKHGVTIMCKQQTPVFAVVLISYLDDNHECFYGILRNIFGIVREKSLSHLKQFVSLDIRDPCVFTFQTRSSPVLYRGS